MAKKLTKSKAKKMLHEGVIRGKSITDKQRRYFGHIASAQEGISMLDPNALTASVSGNSYVTTPKEKSKKRARIIANRQFPEFKEEYERTKGQYAKHYPGGVEFVEARGYDELQKAFGQVAPEEDLIMMAHYNPDAMYGVPVSDPTFQTLDAPKGATLASLFTGLQEKGYKGNCYMGICEGENVAQSLQGAGVNIPMFGTPGGKKWFGANPGSKGGFEDFFFGVQGKKIGEDEYTTSPIDPQIGKDYKMLLSERQQELMSRRAKGTPVTELTSLPSYKQGGGLKRSEDYGSKKKPYPSVKSSDFAGGGRSYPIPTKADAIDALRLAGLHGRSDIKTKVYKKYPELKKYEVGGYLTAATDILQGIQLLKEEKNNKKKTEQLLELSKLVNKASSIRPDIPARKYVRPEDMLINPNELYPSYGIGTNYLAKRGGTYPKAQGGFSFANFNENVGGGQEEGNVGSILGSFIGGGGGQQSGAGKIGSTVGGVAGSFLGPIGTIAGSAIGGLIGGAIGGNAQKKQQQKQEEAYGQLQNAAFQQGTRGLRGQYSAFMKYGGQLPEYNLGGDLQVYDGNAQTISQNPYLPDSGETVMFNGPSHERGGMMIKYGNTPVEVEGGEPAVKLEHGGSAGQDNLVVYGDMKIPSYGASELNDPKAKGKKFKSYIKDLSKIEDKQNKIVERGIDLVNTTPVVDSFDKLKFSSGKAMVEGGNMKLKDIAQKKQTAASIQNAILDTADELGLKSNELAEGTIRKARYGKKIKYAQDGGGPYAHQTDYDDSVREDAFADSYDTTDNKMDWMTVLNSVLPNLRPSNQLPLDPTQLSGEMLALSSNQLEPVQAQQYSPLLESVSDISLQDQLNLNQADFNALLRQTTGQPAAQATLAGQKYAANTGVLGEQFRLNQAQKMGTFNRNRATLNDATLRNLAILDQQYVRQSQAKSATKATAQAALSSIADKIARNKLESRTLGIYENLYNYRFGPRGQAFNLNPLAQFNIPGAGAPLPIYDNQGNITGYRETESVREDRYGMKTGKTKTKTTTTKTTQRNGGLVKALKGY